VPTRSPLTQTAREGFEDHELKLPPKPPRRRSSTRRNLLSLPCLPLTNTRDKQLLLTSSTLDNHHEEDSVGEFAFSQSKSDHRSTKSPAGRESSIGIVIRNPVPPQKSPKSAATTSVHQPVPPLNSTHNSVHQPNPPLRAPRRVSFSAEVQSQLISITAPTRELDSEDELESSSSQGQSDSEFDSEGSDREEFEQMDYAAAPLPVHGATIDDISDDELLLETSANDIPEASLEVENYFTRPGQLARMKSSGRLIEVPEDVIEIQSSSDGIPGYLTKYGSWVTEPPSHPGEISTLSYFL
jgi:hypothetical protein